MTFNNNKVKEVVSITNDCVLIKNHADIFVKLDKTDKSVHILIDNNWIQWHDEKYDEYFDKI